jgi:hypothetical protein
LRINCLDLFAVNIISKIYSIGSEELKIGICPT